VGGGTGDVGVGRIHPLAPRIPNYHLRAAHDAVPALKPTVRMGMRESLACARMKLWDESLGRMVGFPRPAARRT
jgi:omega-6 fatty acid desaturase (delta-12 desaturase)